MLGVITAESRAAIRRWPAAMFHVRPIDHRDASVAAQILAILALAHAQELALMADGDALASHHRARDLHDGATAYLGAFIGPQLVGVLGWAPDDTPHQHQITLLIVHPAHQRQGVARLLVGEALRACPTDTVSVIAGARNIPALSLYDRLRFVPHQVLAVAANSPVLIQLRRTATTTARA